MDVKLFCISLVHCITFSDIPHSNAVGPIVYLLSAAMRVYGASISSDMRHVCSHMATSLIEPLFLPNILVMTLLCSRVSCTLMSSISVVLEAVLLFRYCCLWLTLGSDALRIFSFNILSEASWNVEYMLVGRNALVSLTASRSISD